MKFKAIAALLLFSFMPILTNAQSLANPLHRVYKPGQVLGYHMSADNNGWQYSADARAQVKPDATGGYYEDITWSNLVSSGQVVTPSAAMMAYRQKLSLDPDHMPSPPDLSQVDPQMVGPVTDLMTFYVDLWLAQKFNQLHKPGDHFYFPNPMTPSWADGTRIILGEDAIDFDMTLKSVSVQDNLAVLEVRHVPPPQPRIHLPVEWMQKPVAGTANNWVQVEKRADGTYVAAVGQERFDVLISVSLTDGRIVKATMNNPVATVERVCEDAALSHCSDPKPRHILRQIEIQQVP